MTVPIWLQAGFWGGVAGVALVIGAAAGFYLQLPQRFIASIMAFGSGVLISALAFELMDEAYRQGGFTATAIGFLAGGAVYTLINWWLAHKGAKHRKRSGGLQPSEEQHEGSGLAIAIGSLLDGVPESIMIGTSMLDRASVSLIAVIAIFLSNIPEGLSSAAGMRKAGRSPRYVFGLWCGLAGLMAIAALLGYVIFGMFSSSVVAATTAIAAGAILAMLTDTMIPEAFETAHDFAGLITVFGFLVAFALSKLAG